MLPLAAQGLRGADLCAGRENTCGSGDRGRAPARGKGASGGCGGRGVRKDLGRGSISPTIPLWSYLALLDIDPGRPLVDSLIEN